MSGSSEVSDTASGYDNKAPSPGKPSSFSDTCSRLREYLNEKGSYARESETMPLSFLSMNLFPMGGYMASLESFAKASDYRCAARDPEKAHMTIFYGGQVMVFSDMPARKAMEVMRLAAVLGSQATCDPIHETAGLPVPLHESIVNISQPVLYDIPIARKLSLARFLEKRKDRIVARSPYSAIKNISLIPADKSWLRLAAHNQLPCNINK